MGKICKLGSLRLHLLAFQALITSCKNWSGSRWVCRTCSATHVEANDTGTIYSNVVMWGTNFVAHLIQIVILSSKGPEEPRVQGTRRTIMYPMNMQSIIFLYEESLHCQCYNLNYKRV